MQRRNANIEHNFGSSSKPNAHIYIVHKKTWAVYVTNFSLLT